MQRRGDSRLLVLAGASGAVRDCQFSGLPQLLSAGDLLVFNDTRVLRARLRGRKDSGGQCEILLERILGPREVLAQARSSKGFRPGTRVQLPGGATAEACGREGEFFRFKFDRDALEVFETQGEMPLPPYLGRPAAAEDAERYQTVYAREPGAVAAPTAGLHFEQGMIEALERAGVATARLTLHVGAGTFQPVRVDDLDEHRMHSEWLRVGEEVVARIVETRARGGRVIAVGTTVVRSLESAAASGTLAPLEGETDIFIRPGYQFRVIDALITNFHLPESTLLMLVSAFAGREAVLAAYHHAIEQQYRFFSYGDAMFITPDPASLAPRAPSA